MIGFLVCFSCEGDVFELRDSWKLRCEECGEIRDDDHSKRVKILHFGNLLAIGSPLHNSRESAPEVETE